MKLSFLLNKICSVSSIFDREITGLALDSRQVKSGDLFFAYKGTQLDGREFIDEAIQKGAVAILVEEKTETHNVPIFIVENLNQKISEIAARFYNNPTKSLHIVGITGTNGKTSCSHFIAAALQQLTIPCGIIGTLGYGVHGNIEPTHLTTPDAITLQKILANFLAKNIKTVTMEVSSHSLEQGRVDNIDFDIGIFTNL